jgi:protein O-GlcNAc transferase
MIEHVASLLERALVEHQAGRLEEAERLYLQILQAIPEHPRALHLLGVLDAQRGRRAAALVRMRRAVELEPSRAEFHSNLGMVLTESDLLSEALHSLKKAVELDPGLAEAHNNLGNLWLRLGSGVAAREAYRRAIELAPGRPVFHFNLANSWRGEGYFNRAIESYQSCLRLDPSNAEASCNYGSALMGAGLYSAAIEAYARALRLKPDYADVYKNLGNLYLEMADYPQAIECYTHAARLDPATAELSLVYAQQQACQWPGMLERAQRVIEQVAADDFVVSGKPVTPFAFLALPIPTRPAHQLRCARAWATSKYGMLKPLVAPARGLSQRWRQLRLGYLSADFHTHATAHLIAELFESHDRREFEVVAYSIGQPKEVDDLTSRLQRGVDAFVDLHTMGFDAAAERIRNDQVDILIDLKGYTHGARPEILARRPAPLQVAYLGYPGTMGADFIDYAIVDEQVVPQDQQPYFRESLVYLPGCYQVNDRWRPIASESLSRSDVGLPEQAFVFSCFNSNYKITPQIFGIWLDLLDQTPGSVLWLLASNPYAQANLRREAQSRGMAEERLVFAPPWPSARHLHRQRLADLFLDTFPVCAHTSASDALRVGLPVVTIRGESFVSRVAGSLLFNLGMKELVAASPEEYLSLAGSLANDRSRLAALQARLMKIVQNSDVFDGSAFARKLEKAYRCMWDIFQRGDPPRTITADVFSR